MNGNFPSANFSSQSAYTEFAQFGVTDLSCRFSHCGHQPLHEYSAFSVSTLAKLFWVDPGKLVTDRQNPLRVPATAGSGKFAGMLPQEAGADRWPWVPAGCPVDDEGTSVWLVGRAAETAVCDISRGPSVANRRPRPITCLHAIHLFNEVQLCPELLDAEWR